MFRLCIILSFYILFFLYPVQRDGFHYLCLGVIMYYLLQYIYIDLLIEQLDNYYGD